MVNETDTHTAALQIHLPWRPIHRETDFPEDTDSTQSREAGSLSPPHPPFPNRCSVTDASMEVSPATTGTTAAATFPVDVATSPAVRPTASPPDVVLQ